MPIFLFIYLLWKVNVKNKVPCIEVRALLDLGAEFFKSKLLDESFLT